MKYIKIDDVEYKVKIVYKSLERSFEIQEGSNTGVAITGRQIRDIIGTSYSYTMDFEPDLRYPEDYDSFYEVISQPTDHHIVELPFGQGSLKFEAYVSSGSDTYSGTLGGKERWGDLSVTFTPREPQKTEVDV